MTAKKQLTRDERAALARFQRQQLIVRLHEEGAEDLAARLTTCGERLPLKCRCCGHRKDVERRCERRWCPVCARKIAAERVARYGFAVARMEWPLFVTLTIENSVDAWEGIKKLKSSWGKMRRSTWFRECDVNGGVTCVEITNRGNGWHPHLHSIIDCRWLAVRTPRPQRGTTKPEIASRCQQAAEELQVEWSRITRQISTSVRVKRTRGEILSEVLKYAADPGTLLGEDGRVSELIQAIDRFRMVQPFGSCMGIGAEIRRLAAESHETSTCPTCQTAAWEPVIIVERPHAPITTTWRPSVVRAPTTTPAQLAPGAAQQLNLSSWGYTPPTAHPAQSYA